MAMGQPFFSFVLQRNRILGECVCVESVLITLIQERKKEE